MCLIVFSFHHHREYPFIFAGNRDEFHGRSTSPAHFWDEHPNLLAGRDLKAGGTWLGVDRDGGFATVTNFREPGEDRPDATSRGELVTDFLLRRGPVDRFTEHVQDAGQEYNGFNLIYGDPKALFYASNRAGQLSRLEPGVYGLSNGRLDTPWPKVLRAKSLFGKATNRDVIDPEDLLDLLADEWRPADDELPSTGIGIHRERLASSIFIRDDDYGTRASTVVLFDRAGQVTFVERSYAPGGIEAGTRAYRFSIGTEE